MMENPEIAKKHNEDEKHLERETRRLIEFIEFIAEKMRDEGVPVSADCRINPDSFTGVYSPNALSRDREKTLATFQSFYPGLSEKEIRERRFNSNGEKLEMLKTASFYKNMSRDFIVARASSYDDFFNGVDNVIVDKSTGNVVCAFDEVADASGERKTAKDADVLKKNTKEQGACLRYGLIVKDTNQVTAAGEIKHIPIFKIALPVSLLNKSLKDFNILETKQSDIERKLFAYFLLSVKGQIDDIRVDLEKKKIFRKSHRYDPAINNLITSLNNFEKSLVDGGYLK